MVLEATEISAFLVTVRVGGRNPLFSVRRFLFAASFLWYKFQVISLEESESLEIQLTLESFFSLLFTPFYLITRKILQDVGMLRKKRK